MDEKKNRSEDQPAGNREEGQTPQNMGAPEELLAQVSAGPIAFPDDFVENILSDLEESASDFPELPVEPLTATPIAGSAPAQTPPQEAEEKTDSAPQEELPQDEEQPEAKEDVPEEGQPEAAEEEELPEPERETAEEENTEALPPLDESLALVQNEPEQPDETEGMSLIERARYHARMRRREQTRLRRENARRGGAEPYQPMSMMDVRFTSVRLAVAVVFLLLGLLLQRTSDTVAFILYLIAYLITVLPIAANVARNFTHGKYFDEYLLILVSSFGAFLLGLHAEASVVLILHGVGKMISDLVLSSTHKSLSQQVDFIPERASVVNMQGEERQVTPAEIRVDDFVLVRTGERIPIDGIVLRGEGIVDDTVLTGDSEPAPVVKNAKVLAGSLYTGSLLLLRATAKFEDCAVSQIMRVQEEGAGRKASLEDSVMHGAARFIPVIVVLAILLSVIPPLFNSSTPMQNWVYRALTILVVCCPTALVISVPLSFMGGSGRLSQKGIHVKGSEAVEKMAELRMVVFDKTGTLTEGNLRVKEIHGTQDFNQESILALAAAAEQLSKHPVARAVVSAYQSVPQKISEFEEFPGRGVRARIGNRNLLVGNRRLMVSRGVKGVPDIRGTVVYVAYEGDYAGAIVLEDTVRPEAAEAVSGLKSQGVLRTVILTGDTESPTQQTADAVGIDTVHYGLLPEEKASKMEFLLRTIPTDGTAAYVGDGVNDIEELKLADVGVAMGVAGSQESADAANVLIMTNSLTRLSDAMRVCRRTHNIALQNMVLVLAIKVILVLLTILGVTSMWQAIAADVLLTILTVLNAARILGIK